MTGRKIYSLQQPIAFQELGVPADLARRNPVEVVTA
jgi:hypothetical protein